MRDNGCEPLLPHERDDVPDVAPAPRKRRWPVFIVAAGGGLLGIAVYQAAIVAAAAPYTSGDPFTGLVAAAMPPNLDAVLMWLLVLPHFAAAYLLARRLPGEKPRSLAGVALGLGLWAVPFWYPAAYGATYSLDSLMGVLYHISPAGAGAFAGGLLGDAARRRPPATGLWLVWETCAACFLTLFLVIVVHDSYATRPLLGPALIGACALAGAIIGLSSRGRPSALLGVVGATFVVVLQPLKVLLAFGPELAPMAPWILSAAVLAPGVVSVLGVSRRRPVPEVLETPA